MLKLETRNVENTNSNCRTTIEPSSTSFLLQPFSQPSSPLTDSQAHSGTWRLHLRAPGACHRERRVPSPLCPQRDVTNLRPLAVSVHNPNWEIHADLPAPLSADINFAGRCIGGARLVTAGRHKVEPEKSDRIRLKVAEEVEGMAEVLWSDGVAELVKEITTGQLESLELKLSGKVKYRPVHLGRYKLAVTCPLRLPMMTASGTNVVVVDNVIKCH
ncbi:hypothetical protein HU200_065324 [Digitaria exilis]|uniref:Uncharacterized protein n=1 Tax=Digitaria exilis TaxID=1010633 RepID=A0A835A471_9POAL|nr:hypothetical protein HU200_065324 [Digitaria exilis]